MSDEESDCLHCAIWRAIAEHPGSRGEELPALANVVADILAAAPRELLAEAMMSHNLKVSALVRRRRAGAAPELPAGARLQ